MFVVVQYLLVRVQFTKPGHLRRDRFLTKMNETESSRALETKILQLEITSKRTDRILTKCNEESITRHQGTLRTIISEVEKLRITVEAEKIEKKEDTDEWSEGIDAKIHEADSNVRLTKEWLAENKKKAEYIPRRRAKI